MSETKQLTPEELQQIQELQKQYNQYVFDLGSIEAQLQNVYKAETDLKAEKANVIQESLTFSPNSVVAGTTVFFV